MSRVYHSGPNNSTFFTTCCETAICDDQAYCPKCKNEVYPGKDYNSYQRGRMRWEQAYGPYRARDAAKQGTKS